MWAAHIKTLTGSKNVSVKAAPREGVINDGPRAPFSKRAAWLTPQGGGALVKADVKPSAEKEALEWAVEFFRGEAANLKRDGSRTQGREFRMTTDVSTYHHFSRRDQAKVQRMLKNTVEWAHGGDTSAGQALCDIAADLLKRGEPLPNSLLQFVIGFLRDPKANVRRGRGPNPNDLAHRNRRIFYATREIVDRWKFPATGDNDARSSAASIARDALELGARVNITEAAVNKIWREKIKSMRAARPL